MKKSLIFKLGLGVAAALGVLAVLPFLIPLDSFIPRIEKEAGERLKLPVKIATLRLHFLPTPRVVAGKVKVGAGEIEIERAAAVPVLSSLLSDTRVIRLIDIDGLRVRDSVIAKLLAIKSEGPAAVRIERVRIARLEPLLSGAPAGIWNVEATLGSVIGVEEALLTSSDGKLKIELVPNGKEWKLSGEANGWKVPFGAPVMIDKLAFNGAMTEKGLLIPNLKGQLYGGAVGGRIKLDWARQWQLDGNFSAAGIDVGRLAKVFAPQQPLAGRLDASGRYSARAARPDGLVDAMVLDGQFKVSDGVLRKLDFAEAVKFAKSDQAKNGDTRFDELYGNMALRGRTTQLRNVVVASGVLTAKGGTDIHSDGVLAGTFDVDLKNTKGFVGVPLALSGTLKDPQLSLTKGYKIGAVVGTVVAPGLGTSLGASIGRFFEKKNEK